MRYAILKNNVVTEVVMAGPGWNPPAGHSMLPSETANIGDVFENGEFKTVKTQYTVDELTRLTNDRQFLLMRMLHDFNVDGKIVKSNLKPETRSDLSDLRNWGANNPAATRVWAGTDGVNTPFTGEQFVKLSNMVSEAYLKLFDQYTDIITDIRSGLIKKPEEIAARLFVEGDK